MSFRQAKPMAAVNHAAPLVFAPSFDSEGRLRVLDQDRFAQTEILERESRDFMAGAYGAGAPRARVARARASAVSPKAWCESASARRGVRARTPKHEAWKGEFWCDSQPIFLTVSVPFAWSFAIVLLLSSAKRRPLPCASRSRRLPHLPLFLSTELQEFSSTVHGVVENLSSQAALIEAEKSRAIGLRALAEMEKTSRARTLRELPAAITDRTRDGARLQAELESLQRVEAEQKELVDRLIQ